MRALNAAVPHRKREVLTRAQRECREEAFQRAFEQGRVIERRVLLLRTLLHRFQKVPLAHRRAIKHADGEQLRRWSDLALDAPSVAAVFKAR